MRSILDRSFKYTPAAATDIRKTLNRERKRLAEIAEREKVMQAAKVRPIKERSK